MIFDFTLADTMRLSNIKRWGIIEMSRSQSVAEHSYNVAMIGISIIGVLEKVEGHRLADLTSGVLFWSMVHDLPELVTGDMPTPIKAYVNKDRMGKVMWPEYHKFEEELNGSIVKTIVKAADFLEAIQHAEKFCTDTRKSAIKRDMHTNMKDFLAEEGNEQVRDAVMRVSFE